MEVLIILICIAVVYFTLSAQKAILPEAENKHNHNLSGKSDWQYYKSESKYLRDEWGEIYVNSNDIYQDEVIEGKITIKDGRSNPFMGRGYILEIEGNFVNKVTEDSYITFNRNTPDNSWQSGIKLFKEFIEDGEKMDVDVNDNIGTIKFFSFGFKDEKTMSLLNLISKAYTLTIHIGDGVSPQGGTSDIEFNVRGLKEGLMNFRRGYTKL